MCVRVCVCVRECVCVRPHMCSKYDNFRLETEVSTFFSDAQLLVLGYDVIMVLSLREAGSSGTGALRCC